MKALDYFIGCVDDYCLESFDAQHGRLKLIHVDLDDQYWAIDDNNEKFQPKLIINKFNILINDNILEYYSNIDSKMLQLLKEDISTEVIEFFKLKFL